MAYPYQMNMGNQQPNFAGGMNNQMPGQAPNMGVPNMGVPPAPMPYSPYPPQPSFGYNPSPPQPSFGYNPSPKQQSYGQTSYNPTYSPMGQPQSGMGGQQAIGGLGQTNPVPQFFTDYANQILTKQPANIPQYTTYSAGPMGLPVSIDQSLMGGAATGSQQPTLAQWLAQTKSELDAMLATKPQPSNQPSPYKGYGGYDMTGMSPTLQAYLKDASVKSGMDAAPYYTYNPTTKSFQAIMMGGGFDKTLAEMEADAAAWDTRQKSLSTADQSPFGVKPIAVQTGAPATGANTQSSYAQYNFDPVTQEYLDRMEKKSAMVPDMGTWRYEPATQSFIRRGAYLPLGVPEPRITLAEMQQRAKADAAARASSPDQSPFGVKPIATPTIKPPTPNIAPKPKPIPQQISQRMIELQSKVLGPSYKRTADLQNFLNKLPKTGLTPRQVMAQQQAQQQLRNEEGLRRPYLFNQPTF